MSSTRLTIQGRQGSGSTWVPGDAQPVPSDNLQRWTLGHRVKLHVALKEAALTAGATLRLATSIVGVDPQGGSVTTDDGSVIDADVVVGADGVHSVSRRFIAGADHRPFGSGKSAFRFLIPRQAVLDDPQTRRYAERDGELVMVYHTDRRLVMYPTSDNTLLNLVCIHPEAETASESSGDWNNKATRDMLLHVYADFHDDFRAILSKVDESSLKIWRLLDMVSRPSRLGEDADDGTGSSRVVDAWPAGAARRRRASLSPASRAGRRGRHGGRRGARRRPGARLEV